jgi:hypothetical protein
MSYTAQHRANKKLLAQYPNQGNLRRFLKPGEKLPIAYQSEKIDTKQFYFFEIMDMDGIYWNVANSKEQLVIGKQLILDVMEVPLIEAGYAGRMNYAMDCVYVYLRLTEQIIDQIIEAGAEQGLVFADLDERFR